MDISILTTLLHFTEAHPWIAACARYLSDCGIYVVPVLALGLLLRTEKDAFRKSAYLAVAIMSAVILSEYVLKNIFQVTRPFIELTYAPLADEGGFSYPSTHATFATALAFGWALFTTQPLATKVILGVLAILFCLARIMLGVHYPSDILGGIIVGTVAVLVVYQATRAQLWK